MPTGPHVFTLIVAMLYGCTACSLALLRPAAALVERPPQHLAAERATLAVVKPEGKGSSGSSGWLSNTSAMRGLSKYGTLVELCPCKIKALTSGLSRF